jgi:ATP-dependent RNA helicase DeaD
LLHSFNSFQLHPDLEKALVEMKFTTPTPIQKEAMPVAMAGQDLIAGAQTGSGKTAAFAIPILNHLLSKPEGIALILVPTRELAEQVCSVFKDLLQFSGPPSEPIHLVTLIGGMDLRKQWQALTRKPRILVATPGRMMDHLRRKNTNFLKLEILVLDEADRMLDMGFEQQLNEIYRYLPAKRQTMLFSATLPKNILELSKKYLTNPVQVQVRRTQDSAPKIEQQSVQVPNARKNETLLDQINSKEGSVLVFARTQIRAGRITKYLAQYGLKVAIIHGGRTQAQRKKALDSFRDGSVRILIATDVAARGLDISHVAHVINYDLPQDPSDYVHRIGRTARAGRSGTALSFVTPEEVRVWQRISRQFNLQPKLERTARSGGRVGQ